MAIDPNKNYSATFKTSRGEIVCDLFARDAPKTVNNFVFLAKEKFYDGTVFHRVIADFMVQGGDPTGTGRGGPGYRFEDETKNNPHQHQAGSLSMANLNVVQGTTKRSKNRVIASPAVPLASLTVT